MDAMKVLGSLLGKNATGGSVGNAILESIVKGSGSGAQGSSGRSGGGLLDGLLGAGTGRGAGSQVTSATGTSGSSSGGGLLGGLIESALGKHAQQQQQRQPQSGGLAEALGGLLGGDRPDPVQSMPVQQVNDGATVLIRAMCNAAKADGRIDENEKRNIINKVGDDLGPDEVQFLRDELSKPVDVAAFCQQVPRDMQQQVYALSVMAINLDQQSEAQYLGQLAQGLGMDPNLCNQIHDQLGAPKIFG